jgi:hypothetical protein
MTSVWCAGAQHAPHMCTVLACTKLQDTGTWVAGGREQVTTSTRKLLAERAQSLGLMQCSLLSWLRPGPYHMRAVVVLAGTHGAACMRSM